MRKRTDKERDAELIKRLQDEAPEVLSAKVNFDALVENVLSRDVDGIGISPNRRKSKSTAKPKSYRRTK